MSFFKKLLNRWSFGANAVQKGPPPPDKTTVQPQAPLVKNPGQKDPPLNLSPAKDQIDKSDRILKTVYKSAAIILGFDPDPDLNEMDIRTPLRTYCYGLYEIDLVEIIDLVEVELDITIEDEDWDYSSTPNWENCTILSITELVNKKKMFNERQSPRPSSHAGKAPAVIPAPAASLAPVLYRTGLDHFRLGNYEAADEALWMALVLDDQVPKGKNTNRSELLLKFANLYLEIGLFVKVQPSVLQEQSYQCMLQTCNETFQQTDISMIEALSAFGRIEWGAKRIEQAIILLENAIAHSRQFYGEHDMRTAPHIFNRGKLAIAIGDNYNANDCFRQVLCILIAKYGDNHPAVAEELERQATVYSNVAMYDHAESLIERAIKIRVKLGPGSREVALSAHLLAKICFFRKDFKGARSLLLEAVGIMTNLLISPERRNELLSKQENTFDDSGIIEREAALKDADLREMLKTLAVSWHQTGPPGMTMTKYEQVLSIYEDTYGTEHLETGELLVSIGSFYAEFRKYEKGLHLLQRSLKILEKHLSPNDPKIASVLTNLASVYRNVGNDLEAAVVLERCIQIREQFYGNMHEGLIMPLRKLAYIRAKQNDFSLAIGFLERALEIEEIQITRAITQGSEKQKAHWSNLIGGLSNATMAFHAQFTAPKFLANKIVMTTLLRSKGRVLDALSESLIWLRLSGKQEDLALLARWTSLLTEESNWYASKLTVPVRDEKFDDIRSARENVEKQIALRIAEMHVSPAPRVDVTAVQAALSKESVLVEFCHFELIDFEKFGELIVGEEKYRYAAFVLGPTGDPAWIELGDAKVIDDKINMLRDAWINNEDRWQSLASDLDMLLIEPLRASIDKSTHIFMVPAGNLCLVPFAALVDQQGAYEIHRYTFTYLTTGRDLIQPKQVQTRNSLPLILAGPDYEQIAVPKGNTLLQHMTQSPAWFPPLEHAKEEGRILHQLIPRSILVTGPSASKFTIKEVRAPSILHIASHGFFLPDNRDRLDRVIWEFSGAALPSPLLRSGIALAGANFYREGMLTALEISGLDLSGTELVALSACETGLGDVSSWEGVYGFRRSFFLAGAKSLLASLFPVPDDATVRLMKGFYERLLTGKGRSQALREAQLSMLDADETAHPLNWAAFLLIGDPGPIAFEHQ